MTQRGAYDQRDQNEGNGDEIYQERTNGRYSNGNDANALGQNNTNSRFNQEADVRTGSFSNVRQAESDGNQKPFIPPRLSQSPDRAISIVSELKSNAALFAAFAYGSLNLPGTLTVSESKVTSVTTSLSVSRPLPDSDLIRTFVVLDISTLCLMISCVAASQLLIYRLTDGSYEDVDEFSLQDDGRDVESASYRKKKNSRESALGRLVTTYRNEFTVARITFDLGLVTLLLAVGVRSLAIFDEDIVVPVAFVLGLTSIFLAVAYLTTYVEVFRTAENLPERPLFSIAFPFLTKGSEKRTDEIKIDAVDKSLSQMIPQIVLPVSLTSIGLGLFLGLNDGSGSSESNLSRLGPYDVTSGATKLRVVTDKIDSEKAKLDAKAKNQRIEEQEQLRKKRAERRAADTRKKEKAKRASVRAEAEAAKKKTAEEDATKKAEAEAKKKLEQEAKQKADEEAKRKAEQEAKQKVEEEAKRKAEQEAKQKAEEEAKRKAEDEAKLKAEEEAKTKAMEEAKSRAEEEMKRRTEEEAKKKAMEGANAAAEEAKMKTDEAPPSVSVTAKTTL